MNRRDGKANVEQWRAVDEFWMCWGARGEQKDESSQPPRNEASGPKSVRPINCKVLLLLLLIVKHYTLLSNTVR